MTQSKLKKTTIPKNEDVSDSWIDSEEEYWDEQDNTYTVVGIFSVKDYMNYIMKLTIGLAILMPRLLREHETRMFTTYDFESNKWLDQLINKRQLIRWTRIEGLLKNSNQHNKIDLVNDRNKLMIWLRNNVDPTQFRNTKFTPLTQQINVLKRAKTSLKKSKDAISGYDEYFVIRNDNPYHVVDICDNYIDKAFTLTALPIKGGFHPNCQCYPEPITYEEYVQIIGSYTDE